MNAVKKSIEIFEGLGDFDHAVVGMKSGGFIIMDRRTIRYSAYPKSFPRPYKTNPLPLNHARFMFFEDAVLAVVRHLTPTEADPPAPQASGTRGQKGEPCQKSTQTPNSGRA